MASIKSQEHPNASNSSIQQHPLQQTPTPAASPRSSLEIKRSQHEDGYNTDLEAGTTTGPAPPSGVDSRFGEVHATSSDSSDPYFLRSRLRKQSTSEDGLTTTNDPPPTGASTSVFLPPVKKSSSPLAFFARPFSSRRRADIVAQRRLDSFYSAQDTQILSLLKPITVHAEEAEADIAEHKKAVAWAVNLSFGANVVLMVLQIYAAASSLSLSFFATAIDAIFDPCANLVLNWAHRKAEKIDLQKYPSGGSRLETIGNIVYAGVMGMVSLILVVESIQALVQKRSDSDFHLPAVIAVGVAFFVKLVLFIYCFSLKSKNSQVEVLWEDHRNDLFINGFGIFTSSAGAKIIWWIDPMGAIIISLVLIAVWGDTCITHFSHLAGKSAPTEFLQLVIYKAVTFSDEIQQIDSCKAYHSGPNYVVEVDIVLPPETSLWKAHDLSQDLQDKLESLPRVDRAFVHVDHETSHRPEHLKQK